MNRAEIRRLGRTIADQIGEGQWTDTLDADHPNLFSLNDALSQSYQKYASETLCFRRLYDLLSVADQPLVGYGGFGAVTANVTQLCSAQATTVPLTIAVGEPSGLTDEFRISVSLKNNSGGALTASAVTYTVTGTLRDMRPATEELIFRAGSGQEVYQVAGGASVTLATRRRFATVTSITASATQTSDWTHSSGVYGDLPGTRVGRPLSVAYDGNTLELQNRTALGLYDLNWRYQASGTPGVWIPWDSGGFLLHPAPASDDKTITLECAVLPALATDFVEDTDEPDIPAEDHRLLAVGMVLFPMLLREPSNETAARFGALQKMWTDGISAARGGNQPQPGVIGVIGKKRALTGRVLQRINIIPPG